MTSRLLSISNSTLQRLHQVNRHFCEIALMGRSKDDYQGLLTPNHLLLGPYRCRKSIYKNSIVQAYQWNRFSFNVQPSTRIRRVCVLFPSAFEPMHLYSPLSDAVMLFICSRVSNSVSKNLLPVRSVFIGPIHEIFGSGLFKQTI